MSKVALNDEDTAKDANPTIAPRDRLSLSTVTEKLSKVMLNGENSLLIKNLQQANIANSDIMKYMLADRLAEMVLNGEDAAISGTNSPLLESKQQCLANCSNDDLCTCEDCKWKKRFDTNSVSIFKLKSNRFEPNNKLYNLFYRDLSNEDLQEMMKLRCLGIDLRQHIRYTFNWFMETSGFSTNTSSVTVPNPNPAIDPKENFAELRDSVAL